MTSLATTNLKYQETALLFQKESMTVMAELVLIDESAYQKFTKFQKKVSDGFAAIVMDSKTVASGIIAFREVCPTK